MKVFICGTCLNGGAAFVQGVHKALGALAEVSEIDCMSGCSRDQTLGFRAEGKTAYLFGDLTVADLPELVYFARLYAGSPDGRFADARVLGGLRNKAIARIPG